ncbi:MAG: hypothetical protein P4M02_01920 [Clostridia bacterium]|nr:hypothetical protein [Clostridia bacterium]
MGVTTLISAFYKPLLGQNVNGLITAQVIVIAVAALAVIGVVMMSSRMAGITRAGQGSGSVLQESENAVFVLRGEAGRRGIPCSFDALYDLLKYSDRTVVVPEKENEIRSGIEDLRVLLSATDAAQTQEAIQAKVDELAARMQERNRLALQLKKGGM